MSSQYTYDTEEVNFSDLIGRERAEADLIEASRRPFASDEQFELLFRSIQSNPDIDPATVDRIVVSYLDRRYPFSRTGYRVLINKTQDALYPFVLRSSAAWARMRHRERQQIHAVVALRLHALRRLKNNDPDGYVQYTEQRLESVRNAQYKFNALVQNYPIIVLLLGVVGAGDNGTLYARRVIRDRFDDTETIDVINDALEDVKARQRNLESLVNRLQPLLQAHRNELRARRQEAGVLRTPSTTRVVRERTYYLTPDSSIPSNYK